MLKILSLIPALLVAGNLPAQADCDHSASAPCRMLEFFAILDVPAGLSEAALNAIDKQFELESVDRFEASHLQITSGLVS